MLTFQKVENNQIKELAGLASAIWHEYWTCLLSPEQIDYMVENFQSEKAIKHQIENENYTYYFIKNSGEDFNAGYFGICDKGTYLFLSKLYIKKDFRHQGIGTKTFEKIKELANRKPIRLTVNKYNKNSIAAYRKWGFKIIDSVVTDIGSGFVMDDFVMQA